MRSTIDIIIPSFNGKSLLEKHLPQVISASSYINKIIVVDDGSTDTTQDWLFHNYPEVICLRQDKNLGFNDSINLAARYSKADFIALINNDVSPKPGYLEKAIGYFKDKTVFAVTFNEENSSWPHIKWDGKLNFTRGEDKSRPHYSAWASGGSAIFDKNIWDRLEGFDPALAPAYWEDMDLGYRAWKIGYKIIWDNQAIVVHEHEQSYSKLDQNFLNRIKQRNELLFNWLNITDLDLKASHLRWLILHTLSHPGYLMIILSALGKFISHGNKRNFKLTDKEVISMVNQPLP